MRFLRARRRCWVKTDRKKPDETWSFIRLFQISERGGGKLFRRSTKKQLRRREGGLDLKGKSSAEKPERTMVGRKARCRRNVFRRRCGSGRAWAVEEVNSAVSPVAAGEGEFWAFFVWLWRRRALPAGDGREILRVGWRRRTATGHFLACISYRWQHQSDKGKTSAGEVARYRGG